MDAIQVAFVPLGAFWVSFSTLMAASKFVNDMRESVVIGLIGSNTLTLSHRRAVLLDWCLTMAGIICAALTFCAVTLWLAHVVGSDLRNPHAANMIYAVATFPFAAAIGFSVCGQSDLRLMRAALEEASMQLPSMPGRVDTAEPTVAARRSD